MSIGVETRIYKPYNSIVGSETRSGDDNVKPFIFTEWLTRIGETSDNQSEFIQDYNRYIRQWNSKVEERSSTEGTKDTYKQFLRNIVLNFTTSEEKRFLTTIDYNNPRHLEPALAFFARKLNDITQYYANQRESIKYTADRLVSSGSKRSIEKYIQTAINDIIERRRAFETYVDVDKSEKIQSRVTISELYESQPENIIGEYVLTDEIFSDFSQAVVELLRECTPTLELGEGLSLNVSGDVEPTEENINLLDYSNFINYEKSFANLKLVSEVDYIKKITGAAQYTIQDNELVKLFEPTQPWRDIYSRHIPDIRSSSKQTKLLSKYQIGTLYIPQNLGTLTYYSYDPKVNVIGELDDTITTDITKYGDDNLTSVVSYIEDVTWLKADTSNEGLFGKVVGASHMPKFYSYRSANENTKYANAGISRSYDALSFFTGEENKDWANEDIFTLKNKNIYPLENRQETLLVNKGTVVSWSTDMFGNEYALIKDIKQQKNYNELPATEFYEFVASDTCQIIDGGSDLIEVPPLWSEGVEYNFYEGGRVGGYDPKIEQSLTPRAFSDLRRTVMIQKQVVVNGSVVTILEPELEEHNTHLFGAVSGTSVTRINETTFHGFEYDGSEPVYDDQVYCGLFTDTVCDEQVTFYNNCEIKDNYAFAMYSDILSGEDQLYISTPTAQENDGFEVYYNSDYQSAIGFTNEPTLSSTTVYSTADVDGSNFAAVLCTPGEAEYEYQVNDTDLFEDISSVSRTKFSSDSTDNPYRTTYDKNTNLGGEMIFRSGDGANIANIADVLGDILRVENDSNYILYDRETIREQILSKSIIDMDIINDVVYIQTETYIFAEKISYDYETRALEKSNYPSLILKTTNTDPDRERGFKHMYNPTSNTLITGQTSIFTREEKVYVEPILHVLDVKTMETYTSKSLPSDELILTGELSACQISYVDRPITTYNKITDVYTVTFTAGLSSANEYNSAGICVYDYMYDDTGLTMISAEIHHTDLTQTVASELDSWEMKTEERTILLGPDVTSPTTHDKTHTLSMSAIDSTAYRGFGLSLNIDTRTIPISSDGDNKINRIMFDPGDGSPIKHIHRRIMTGGEPITFNIVDIPDQSDFGDPRIEQIEHRYTFEDGTSTLTTATLTAVYTNTRKLIVDINIEREPYTLTTAFDAIKLIDTRTYSDELGSSRQMLVLETQNPRHISFIKISKSKYTNSSIVGYVDNSLYSGPYHQMLDGTLMTDTNHNPGSVNITPI
jgi:hypothetical protein